MYSVHETTESMCAKYYIAPKITENKKVIQIDRDGVINQDYGYVNTVDRLVVNSEFLRIIGELELRDVLFSIISNQAGIAHGFYSEEKMIEFNLSFLTMLYEKFGMIVGSFWYCPSHPFGRVARYRKKCICRKPESQLLKSSLIYHKISEHQTIYVGNQRTDFLAASKVGIKYIDVKRLRINDLNLNNDLSY